MSGHDKEIQSDYRNLNPWWTYGEEARAEKESGFHIGFASGFLLPSSAHQNDGLVGAKYVPLGYVALSTDDTTKINAEGGFAPIIAMVAGSGGSFPAQIQKGTPATEAVAMKDANSTHESVFPALVFGVDLEPMDGKIPDVGERGFVVRGTKFGTTLNNLWYSADWKRSGDAALISHHVNPNAPNNSSDVFDPDGDSSRFAGLDKLTQVLRQVGGCGGGDTNKFTLALNMAEDTGQAGIFTFMSSNASVSNNKKDTGNFVEPTLKGTAAFMQTAHKGPFTAGHPTGDKHFIGKSDDMNVNSGHITTEAFYYMDKTFDGPLNFEPLPVPPLSDGFVERRLHRHFDQTIPHEGPCGTVFGKWIEYTKEVFFVPEPPITPGPPIRPPAEPPIITPKEIRAPSQEGVPSMQRVPPPDGDPGVGGGDGEGGEGAVDGSPTVNGQDISDWLKGVQAAVEQEVADGFDFAEAHQRVMDKTPMHPAFEQQINVGMASSGYTLRQLFTAPVAWHESTFARKDSTDPEAATGYLEVTESKFQPSMNLNKPLEWDTGTADGVKMFASFDLTKDDMITGASDRPAVADIAQATFGIDKDATLAFGSLSADEGEVVDGFRIYMGTHPVSGTDYQALLHECIDADGAHDATKAEQFLNPIYDKDGGEIISLTGYVIDTVSGETLNFTGFFGKSHWVTGTTAITGNMPEITESDIGKILEVVNDSTKTVTMDGDGTDTIQGALTLAVLTGMRVTLRAMSLTQWVIV